MLIAYLKKFFKGTTSNPDGMPKSPTYQYRVIARREKDYRVQYRIRKGSGTWYDLSDQSHKTMEDAVALISRNSRWDVENQEARLKAQEFRKNNPPVEFE